MTGREKRDADRRSLPKRLLRLTIDPADQPPAPAGIWAVLLVAGAVVFLLALLR